MAEEEIIKKILVEYDGLNGKSRVHCIRLPDEVPGDKIEPDDIVPVGSTCTSPPRVLSVTLSATKITVVLLARLEPGGDDEGGEGCDDTPRAIAALSIERQIFDFLAEADHEGLTNRVRVRIRHTSLLLLTRILPPRRSAARSVGTTDERSSRSSRGTSATSRRPI